MADRRRLAWVTAVPVTVKAFLSPLFGHLRRDFEIHVVSSFEAGASAEQFGADTLHTIAIPRPIQPARDLEALARLVALMRRERFDVVHSVTPKAGLLGMTAARLARVPRRIHTFTGQVWATRTGVMREVLKTADRAIVHAATDVLADGRAQAGFLVEQRIARKGRIGVLAEGSIAGVDLERFRPDPQARAEVRQRLGISDDAILVLFLGRVNRDKGVPELSRAAAQALAGKPNAHLLVVGPSEGPIDDELARSAAALGGRFHRVGFVPDPERWFAAADTFVIPSHREGFGTAVLEAAACGLPAIASDIYGLRDAVVDGETALVVPVGSEAAIARALESMVTDAALRARLARGARERTCALFGRDRLAEAYAELYRRRPS
jgi:glycosyltransferase involved in cell wall biosynthesis